MSAEILNFESDWQFTKFFELFCDFGLMVLTY